MMNYNTFKQALIEGLQEKIEEGVTIELKWVKKTNNNEREGIMISGSNAYMAPIIYLEQLYEYYQNGGELEEIIEILLSEYQNLPVIQGVEMLTCWENVKEKLALEIINFEWNKKLLEEVPHCKLCDLAVVCRIKLIKDETEQVGCIIKKYMIEKWGITEAMLFEEAFKHLQKEDFHIKDIRTVIQEILGMDSEMVEEEQLETEEGKPTMYVMSNKDKLYGASGILCTEILNDFSEKHQKNFFVLPSSLHELIFIADDGSVTKEYLKEMVEQVNEKCVDAEEKLSNSVYYYRREERKVEKIA